MKATAPLKKVKSSLSKISKKKVLKKREKDGLGKKEGALLAVAQESLTTPEKKIIAKSVKMKKLAVPTNPLENNAAKPPLVSKSRKKPTVVPKAPVVPKVPVVAKSVPTKENSDVSTSLKKSTGPKSKCANSPVVTKSPKVATVSNPPVAKSVRSIKKQKMNVVESPQHSRKRKRRDMVIAMRQKRSVAKSSGEKQNLSAKSLKISKKTPSSLVKQKIAGKKQKQNIVAVSSEMPAKKLKMKKKENIKPVVEFSGALEAELLKGACASALKVINKSHEGQEKKDLFGSLGEPVYLQLTLFKVPDTSKRDFRISVPHSIFSTDPDVLLIVPDIRRGRFRDVTFAKYLEEYEEKLREAGIKGVKQIIPFAQLRAENSQFELKRRLVHSYDIIACDARLSGHCTHFLGPALQKCNKHIIPLRITVDNDSNSKRRNFQFTSDLQRRLDMARLKAFLTFSGEGTSFGINLGHSLLSAEQLADNVQAVWTYLGKQLPGGLRNIKTAYLKGAKTLPVPVYASLVPLKKLPVVKPKKTKHSVEDEISTLPGFTTIVDSSGNVKVVNRQTAEDREFFKTVLGSKKSNKRSMSGHRSESKRIKKTDDENENDTSEDDGDDDKEDDKEVDKEVDKEDDGEDVEEAYLKDWAESAIDLEKKQKDNQGKTNLKRNNKKKKGSK